MQRKLEAAGVDSETAEFPFAELVVALGFFLVLIIEQSVIQCQKVKRPVKGGGREVEKGEGRGEEKEKEVTEFSSNNNQLFLEHHGDHHGYGGGGTLLRASLLILALSIHSLFEGKWSQKR